jgi:hypothetical protein
MDDILDQLNINTQIEDSIQRVVWNELNDNWEVEKKQNQSVYDGVNKNGSNENLDLLSKTKGRAKKRDPGLFDERHMHIKKSSGPKKVAIENLHFENNMQVPTFNSLDVVKVTNQPAKVLAQFAKKAIVKKPNNEEYDPNDVKLDTSRLIKMTEGDEYNVKRKIIKNSENTKSFVLNLTVPEHLTKIGEVTDRIKIISEQVFNPPPENAVYTGKPKSSLNNSQILADVKNEGEDGAVENPPGEEVQLGENQEMIPDVGNVTNIKPNLNVTGLIMKNMDKKTYLNSLKTREGIASRKIKDDVVYDEFHTRITTTLKIETNTFLGDEFHIPVSEVQEAPKKENEDQKQKTDLNTSKISKEDENDIDPNLKMVQMNSGDNFNMTDISRISRHYSQLNIEEVWDNSIIDDDFMFDVK